LAHKVPSIPFDVPLQVSCHVSTQVPLHVHSPTKSSTRRIIPAHQQLLVTVGGDSYWATIVQPTTTYHTTTHNHTIPYYSHNSILSIYLSQYTQYTKYTQYTASSIEYKPCSILSIHPYIYPTPFIPILHYKGNTILYTFPATTSPRYPDYNQPPPSPLPPSDWLPQLRSWSSRPSNRSELRTTDYGLLLIGCSPLSYPLTCLPHQSPRLTPPPPPPKERSDHQQQTDKKIILLPEIVHLSFHSLLDWQANLHPLNNPKQLFNSTASLISSPSPSPTKHKPASRSPVPFTNRSPEFNKPNHNHTFVVA
jgi:hypothetical protein